MYDGIDNVIVIKNIFGEKYIFDKGDLINVNWQMIDSRIELSILVHDNPTNVPKKWGAFKSVYVKLELYGFEKVKINLKEDTPKIQKFMTQNIGDKYYCEIYMDNEQEIKGIFEIGRIQNVKPYVAEKK